MTTINLRQNNKTIKLTQSSRAIKLSQVTRNITLKSIGISDKNYVQVFTNQSFLTITHNLNKYPSVTVINSASDEVFGNVFYLSLNALTVTFIGSFSGKVTCN